jgi:hypothetical protein
VISVNHFSSGTFDCRNNIFTCVAFPLFHTDAKESLSENKHFISMTSPMPTKQLNRSEQGDKDGDCHTQFDEVSRTGRVEFLSQRSKSVRNLLSEANPAVFQMKFDESD